MPWAKIEANFDMYYESDDFTDPWKSPETIVLHHGNAKNGRQWHAWVPLLARRFRVVRLDARGFGRSTVPPPGYPWSLSNFAKDIDLLLDYLGLDRVHLVGETVGGTIAMRFAYEYPERLRSLTLCSSRFRFTEPFHSEFARKVEKEGVLGWARSTMARRLDPSEVDPNLVNWYTAEMGKSSKHVVLEALVALTGHDFSDMLRQISAPTLILSAENRSDYSADYMREMHELIPNSELVVFPGAAGYIQVSQPEKCVQALLAFLEKL
ncbi:MAG: alpha/beta hydrolase [Chloroflexi bacterium]|nr:alpha/beta hydrolase [Chloroflexota bacterium]